MLNKICFSLFLIFLPGLAFAQNWVSTENVTGPKVYLDTDSIFIYNRGIVYTTAYSKNGKKYYIQLFLKNDKVSILNTSNTYQNTYVVYDTLPMKEITPDKPIYNSIRMVQSRASVTNICSDLICKNGNLIAGVDMSAYIKDAQKDISSNWGLVHYPHNKVIVEFTIAKDGRLTNVHILKSSGNDMVDRSAMSTVKVTKFKSLPSDFKDASITINFTF